MCAMSVLLADDDPVIRRLFEKRLLQAGYEVFIAQDGREAARLLDSRPFDVVITDLVMPEIGGLELLQITKEKHPDAEVIMITAHSSVDTAVAAMKQGAADYLEKPVNFDELFLRLEKIEQLRSLVRNAGDLREAMNVTESLAAETIQRLEVTAQALQSKIDLASNTLRNQTMAVEERLEQALAALER